jgi:uncharacterized membrane protein (DUF4010 family)
MGIVNTHYGNIGAGIAAAITGVFDVHASAASTLSLALNGRLEPSELLLPVLVAFSTNTVSKLVAAALLARRIAPPSNHPYQLTWIPS